METTTASGSAYEQQSVNSKNKRKKFNPKFLSSNSSSDDDGEAPPNDEEAAKSSEDDKLHNANNSHNVPGYSIPNTNFSITKSQNNNDSPPPTLLQQFQVRKGAQGEFLWLELLKVFMDKISLWFFWPTILEKIFILFF